MYPIDTRCGWGFYTISYKRDIFYIARTKRAPRHRVKDYDVYVKFQNIKSSAVQHSWTCNSRFNFSTANIIQKCLQSRYRLLGNLPHR